MCGARPAVLHLEVNVRRHAAPPPSARCFLSASNEVRASPHRSAGTASVRGLRLSSAQASDAVIALAIGLIDVEGRATRLARRPDRPPTP